AMIRPEEDNPAPPVDSMDTKRHCAESNDPLIHAEELPFSPLACIVLRSSFHDKILPSTPLK
ncbi:hypothetical protein ABVT39_011316, partial [Epinephelus coioides]